MIYYYLAVNINSNDQAPSGSFFFEKLPHINKNTLTNGGSRGVNDQSSMRALLDARMQAAQERRTHAHARPTETARVFEPEPQPVLIKPTSKSWEELKTILKPVINLDGVWSRARTLYDQGYGAELETAAELAQKLATIMPSTHYFASSIGKKTGYWETKTLPNVQATWDVRRNALRVIRELALKAASTMPVLALAWRLKGMILRFLALATKQGTGINNPAGVFFALTRKQLTS